MYKYMDVHPAALFSFELTLLLRSMDINMRHIPNQRLPINVTMLNNMVIACDSLNAIGKVLKCATLLGFYGFLRQSNLAPNSATTFDPTRHTCRGDVIIHPPGLVVILKWTKTSQTSCNHHLVPIPEIKGHALCPVNTYHDMVTTIPASPNQPLLLIPRPSGRLTTNHTYISTAIQRNTRHSGIQPKRFHPS